MHRKKKGKYLRTLSCLTRAFCVSGIPTLLGADRMSNEKEIIKAFEDNIISLSLDDTHVIAGLNNGKVSRSLKELYASHLLIN